MLLEYRYYNMKYFKFNEYNFLLKPEHITLKQIQNLYPVVNQSLYSYLHESKELICQYSEQWDIMKKYTNMYEYIHSAYEYKKYVSKLKPLSRAYYKMIEMLDVFRLLEPFKYTSINSFHLAEGPGGFIEALAHKRENSNDKYYGMTLINDDDNTPGWKKSEDFLNRYPNVVIETGETNTGDLMKIENYQYCYDNYRHSMDIVTGDGGFDFSVDYNKQEESALLLIYTQIIYALMLQKEGGTFILKIFDTFSVTTIQMLFLLNIMYTNVCICKPHTSRCANSEKYVVCTGFKKHLSYPLFQRFKDVLQILHQNSINGVTQTNTYFFLNLGIHHEFLKTIKLMNAIIGQQQIENIHKTIQYIQQGTKDKLHHEKMNHVRKCIEWCVRHNIPHNQIVHRNIFQFSENQIVEE